jgi:hypothetical protein
MKGIVMCNAWRGLGYVKYISAVLSYAEASKQDEKRSYDNVLSEELEPAHHHCGLEW